MAQQVADASDDDVCCFEPSLFLNEDYEEVTYEVGAVRQRVLCLRAASTDHDLTGQVVWPVSCLLAWFCEKHRGRFAGARVLEVGAGCGLAGLVARSVGADATLTDGSDVVCRLLARATALAPGATSRKLVWGDRASFDALGGAPWDFVLGADVVQWPALVAPLLQTVRAALCGAARDDAAFLLGLAPRAATTVATFFAEAERRGFVCEDHALDSFLPDPRPANTASAIPLRVVELRLRERAPADVFQSDDPDFSFESAANAC